MIKAAIDILQDTPFISMGNEGHVLVKGIEEWIHSMEIMNIFGETVRMKDSETEAVFEVRRVK